MKAGPRPASPSSVPAPPGESVSFKVLRNSASNLLRGAVSLPIALILTPVLIGALGIRDFGVWALFFVFVQSGALFDLGMSSSLIKYVAEFNEKEEYGRLNRTLNTALLAYVALGFGIVAVLWLLREVLVQGLFKAEAGDAQLLLVISLALAVFFAQFVFSLFYSVLQGLQRIDLANAAMVAVQVLHFALALAALGMGFGLAALVAAYGVAVIVGGLAAVLLVGWQCPRLRWSLRELAWEPLRRLLPLSLSLQGLSFQTLVFYQFDKIALSAYLGPVYAGYYDAAARPLASLRNFPLAMVQPVMPAISELQARQDRERIQRVCLLTCKLVVLCSAPLFLAIFFLSRPLLDLWLGERVEEGMEIIAWNLRLLALAYFVNVAGAAISYVAAGLGDPRVLFRYAGLAAALQIALTPLGLYFFGYIGAPLGILAATTVAVGFYFWDFHQRSGLGGLPVLGAVWKPAALAILLGLAAAGALPDSTASSGLRVGALVFFYFAAYAAGAWWLGCVSREEMTHVADFLQRARREASRALRRTLRAVARGAFRLFTLPDQKLKQALVRRYGPGEQCDRLTLRTALLWGWGLDRMRRNITVANRVRELHQGTPLRVLDVGAADGGVRPFLPEYLFQVCSVDIDRRRLTEAGVRGSAVCADGSQLPFADASFDVVVSVDCLEHVPASRRPAFLKELARVARRRVVLHFPADDGRQFQGGRFDALFRRRFRLMMRRDQNIEEHIACGLPDAHEVARHFPGCRVAERENGSLWLRYMLLERVPYLGFLTGLLLLGARSRLDAPPWHAALLVCDVARTPAAPAVDESG